MLSQSTVDYISKLPFRADAKRAVSLTPLGGVFWSDEVADFPSVGRLPESSRLELLRLFEIRYALWKHHPLSPDDQQYWDSARVQAPQYAIFQRIEVTSDIVDLQNQIEEESDAIFNALASQAANVGVTPRAPGVEAQTLALGLAQEPSPKLPWWKRLRRRITNT